MKKTILGTLVLLTLISILCLPHVLAETSKTDHTVLPKGFVPYNDLSACPVKILAYRINDMESGETTVSLLLQNTFNLQVVGYQGTFELSDANGQPVNSVQGDPIFMFKERLPIPADAQPYQGSSFVVEEGHHVKRIIPQINQVLFEDQSIWRGF